MSILDFGLRFVCRGKVTSDLAQDICTTTRAALYWKELRIKLAYNDFVGESSTTITWCYLAREILHDRLAYVNRFSPWRYQPNPDSTELKLTSG
jgi:hypothetical protein